LPLYASQPIGLLLELFGFFLIWVRYGSGCFFVGPDPYGAAWSDFLSFQSSISYTPETDGFSFLINSAVLFYPSDARPCPTGPFFSGPVGSSLFFFVPCRVFPHFPVRLLSSVRLLISFPVLPLSPEVFLPPSLLASSLVIAVLVSRKTFSTYCTFLLPIVLPCFVICTSALRIIPL